MTPQQRNCLDVIRRLSVGGCVPLGAEIATELGRSRTAAYMLIRRLAAKGLVEMEPGRRREVRIIGDLRGALNQLVERYGDATVRAELDAVIKPMTKGGWQCKSTDA